MIEASPVPAEGLSVLFWISWLLLFYLAWPRLVATANRLLRKPSAGKPVTLTVPPAAPRWDSILETNLARATTVFLGLSILGLLLRRPQLERYSIPLFALALVLTLLVRWWRSHILSNIEPRDILFPHVSSNTTLGLRLLKVQDLIEKLRQIAVALRKKGDASADIAGHLVELVEKIRVFLLEIRLEQPDSAVLRQARSMFVRLETLADSFELLARLSDEVEVRELSIGLIDVLANAKISIDELRTAQSESLANQLDILISVLRERYTKSS